MQKLLALFFSLCAYTAYANEWQTVSQIHFYPGYYNSWEVPIPIHDPMQSNLLRFAWTSTCGNVQTTRMAFVTGTSSVRGTLQRVDQVPGETQWVYKLDRRATVTGIRMEMSIPSDCWLYIEQTEAQDEPPPPPPPPKAPEERHCRKVASDIAYEYYGHYDQVSAMAGEPCFVFIRFHTLQEYRYFLDTRRSQGKSPDEEIMQPENVKVTFEERVGNG